MTSHADLEKAIESLWEVRDTLSPESPQGENVVAQALSGLDDGSLRVAERDADGAWRVHAWLRKAILLSFRLRPNRRVAGAADGGDWWDKVASKCADWSAADFERAGFRAVPGSVVRYSAHIEADAVLMPCFINLGARVGRGTMIDTWSTVGSCAQIGARCHISGGVGIGGVLEPLQATPVIVEDDCFIGARSEVAEGVVVETGSVISMGVFLGASTKIIDRHTGEIIQGRVPAWSVVVPGSLPGRPLADGSPGPGLGCAVIVKRVDERTRARTSINDLLRTL